MVKQDVKFAYPDDDGFGSDEQLGQQIDSAEAQSEGREAQIEGITTPPDDQPEGEPTYEVPDETIQELGGVGGQQEAGSQEEVEYSPELLRAAGITPEQAASQFGNPEALEAAVQEMDRRFIQQQQPQQFQQPPQSWQPPVQQQPQTQAQRPAQAPAQENEFQMPELAEGEWDQDTINLVNALNAHHQAQLQALQQQQAQLAQVMLARHQAEQQQAQERQAREYIDAFDDYVTGLGEDWSGTFGKGRFGEVDPQSIYMHNRRALDQAVQQLAAGIQATGQPLPPREEIFARALRVTFPQQQKQAVVNEVTQKVAGRRRQFTNRPTQRRNSPLSREEKAARTAERIFSERGLGPDYSVHDDFSDGSF